MTDPLAADEAPKTPKASPEPAQPATTADAPDPSIPTLDPVDIMAERSAPWARPADASPADDHVGTAPAPHADAHEEDVDHHEDDDEEDSLHVDAPRTPADAARAAADTRAAMIAVVTDHVHGGTYREMLDLVGTGLTPERREFFRLSMTPILDVPVVAATAPRFVDGILATLDDEAVIALAHALVEASDAAELEAQTPPDERDAEAHPS